MKSLMVWSFLGLSILLTGCGHHRDVRAGVDGTHRVIVQSEESEQGAQNAISQANHYCQQFDKSAAFLDENKKYTGTMSESDYRTAKTASKVAQGIGSAGYVFGGRNEKTAGGIVGLGGSIARGAIGDGYSVEMRFKCQ